MSIVSFLTTLVLPIAALLSPSEELDARRTEAQLLNRELTLRDIRAWDRKSLRWLPKAPPHGTLLMINLWSVDCPPCIAELPLLEAMAETIMNSEPGLSVAFISETADDRDLFQFLAERKGLIPQNVELYQVTTNELRRRLGTLKRPLTLLLDRHLVVRQAFIGSVVTRRSELVESIERLLHASKIAE